MPRLPLACTLALAGTLAAAPAGAEPVAPTYGNGRALADPQVFAVIVAAQMQGRYVLTADETQKIADLFMADGTLDANEADLADELLSDDVRAIDVAPLQGTAKSATTASLPNAARAPLEDLFARRYAAIYGSEPGKEQWQQLVVESRLSPGALNRVRAFLGTKADPAMKDSALANVYQPARTLISVWFARNGEIAPELQDSGRWLIYSVFDKANAGLDPKLPDYLYSWIRPQPKG